MHKFFSFVAPYFTDVKCFRFAKQWHFKTAVLGWLLISIATVWGLYFAPMDYQQLDAFRIIYVHVPSAFLSMAIYLAMAVMSAFYMIFKLKNADIIAYSLAPVGMVMTFVALVTGSIWGKPMWGTWWVWDARLTSELVLFFLYLSYIALYDSFRNKETAAKICAVLAVVGALDLPIIHFSVNWWFTLHQGATFTSFSGPKIAASMMWPALVMMVGLIFFIMNIVLVRFANELWRRSSAYKQNLLTEDL